MRSDRLASALETERVYEDGQTIVSQGDEGRELFIVLEGEVVVSRRMGGNEVTLSRVCRGEIFGEMSVLESMPREADARASGRVRVLVLGPGALLVRLRRDPSFGLELLHLLSGRVRALNAQLEAALGARSGTGD